MPYVYSFLGFLQLCFNSELDEQGGASGLIQLIKESKLGKGSSDSRRAENVRGKWEESTQAYAHTYIHTHTHTHTHTHRVLSSNRGNKENMRSSWERILGQTYLKKGKFLIRLRDEVRI